MNSLPDLGWPWYLWALLFLALLLAMTLESAFRRIRQITKERTEIQARLDTVLETPLLAFSGVSLTPLLYRDNPDVADVDIGLYFDNVSATRVRYRIESIQVSLAGKTVSPHQTINYRGAVILPSRQAHFLYPMIRGVDCANSPILGRVEYAIQYETIPLIRKFRQQKTINLEIYPPKEIESGNWYSRFIFDHDPDDQEII